MARPKKEKELNHYHFVSVRLSDIELENVDKAAYKVSSTFVHSNIDIYNSATTKVIVIRLCCF